MTEAGTNKPDGNVSPKPLQPSASPSEGCRGTPERKSFRSGYAREKYRRQKLISEIDALTAENTQLKDDLALLEEMFQELKQLNEGLVSDLKQARQRPSGSSFTNVLMGAHRG
jgi:hypothetical protein